MLFAKGSIQGQELTLTQKLSSAKKLSFIISGMGMELGGVKINDKTGFEIQQGQRKEMDKGKYTDSRSELFHLLS